MDQEAEQPQAKRRRAEPAGLSMAQWRVEAQESVAAVNDIMEGAVASAHRRGAEGLAKDLMAIARALLQKAKRVT